MNLAEWFIKTGSYEDHMHVKVDSDCIKVLTRHLGKDLMIKLQIDSVKQLVEALQEAIKAAEGNKNAHQ